MIQRIQTIYLLLAALVCAAFIFTPFAISGSTLLQTLNFMALVALSGVVALLSLGNIFLFKNRKLQITLCRVALLVILALIGGGIYYALATDGQDLPQYGAALPVLGTIFEVLAMRGVQADEKLIRSMDRLR
ncbi:DUF4293 domain-containing protein [Sphingobacteriales bacterium UPWRP_1]|nr:DUF4293 domain-containing protein [Sphingobacteriales bacterium UPWRP_1]